VVVEPAVVAAPAPVEADAGPPVAVQVAPMADVVASARAARPRRPAAHPVRPPVRAHGHDRFGVIE
jgi:hypothetical protein